VLWLTVAGLAAAALRRSRAAIAGAAALTAFAVFVAALGIVAAIMPMLPQDPPMPRVNLQARSRLAALDRFDVQALPAAIVYDPLRKTNAGALLSAMTLQVTPGTRPDPQPIRVLHNGRFSLPAGDYRLDVTFVPDRPVPASDVSLQVGRVGPPLQTWPLPAPSGSIRESLRLPADASFVGLRGSRAVEEAVQAISFTPLSVVNAGERVRTPPVLGAARYGGALVLLHDDQVNPEPTGFWILGRRRTVLSVAPDDTAESILRVRSDAPDNSVTLSTHGWSRTVTLQAGQAEDIQLPPPQHGLVELTIETSTGFIPMDKDPSSRDRRFLGVWIEPR
jgi:hypothetical protein